jgi:hypothetical protein
MKYSGIALELLAIASITAGSGLLLHLLFGSHTTQQRLLIAGVVVAVIAWKVHQMLMTASSDNPLRFVTQTVGSKSKASHPHSAGVSYPTRAQEHGGYMEMTRYFAWIETKLQELVVREELECGLVRMKRGPLVITLQLRLINPTQKDLQKLMKLGPALAQLLQVETVRIADSAQGIMVEVPSPRPLTPNGARLARNARGMHVAIGVDAAARPVIVNLEDHGALFWVGPSRRGKTQSMKAALYALIRANVGRVQFLIIASPAKVMKDWGVFASVAGCLGVACTKDDITSAMQWLVADMNSAQRYSQGIHTILVVDDLPNILKAVPQISQSLADIAGMGAGLGVHLLVGTQGAGSKSTSGGTEIENNVTARILYRPSTSRSGSQSAGIGGLALHQLSSAKGDALALIDGQSIRIATAWIGDREIALLPQRGDQPSPWVKDKTPDALSRQQPVQNNRFQQPEAGRTTWNNSEQAVGHPKIGQNHDGTSQNKVEQGRTSSTPGSFQCYDSVRNGHAAKRSLEHVPEQHAEQTVEQPLVAGIEEYLRQLAALSIEELKQENLSFDATHFPTPDEQRVILAAYGLTLSIRKTCFMTYGHYNGKVRDYIKPVIAGAGEIEETAEATDLSQVDGIPDSIDLNTEEGRSLLALLQQKRLVKWPDARDVLDEG